MEDMKVKEEAGQQDNWLPMQKLVNRIKKYNNSHKFQITPNLLTEIRIYITPILFLPIPIYLAIAILLLGISLDLMDGTLARSLNMKSFIGTLIDHFADRYLGLAVGLYQVIIGILDPYLLAFLVSFEIYKAICLWRLSKRGQAVKPNSWGRWQIIGYGIVFFLNLLVIGILNFTFFQPCVYLGLGVSLFFGVIGLHKYVHQDEKTHHMRKFVYGKIIKSSLLPGILLVVAAAISINLGTGASSNIFGFDGFNLYSFALLTALWTAYYLWAHKYYWVKIKRAFYSALNKHDDEILDTSGIKWDDTEHVMNLINKKLL